MSFGKNLQFLRKIHNGMTQEELAEKMKVTRQTVSKWELDLTYPELEKVIELCQYFSCSMDQLIREDIYTSDEAYTDIRIEKVKAFSYVRYIVISEFPEDDAINHIRNWAIQNKIDNPVTIGWDFPMLSQEQINVYHMHGYVAACVLPDDFHIEESNCEIVRQEQQKYAVITVREPFKSPFTLIPNAYKTLMRYIDVNGLKHIEEKEILTCYEKVYKNNGIEYMDIYIAIAN